MANSSPNDKGLPCNVDAERFVLGSIMLDGGLYYEVAGALEVTDFSLESHRRIFNRLSGIQERNEKIDRVTLAAELARFGELESVGGLSYIVSLDDGLPQTPHIDSYCRLVKEAATKRQVIFASQHMINRCMMAEEDSSTILAGARETMLSLGVDDREGGPQNVGQIIESAGGISTLFGMPKQGLLTGFSKYDEMTGGLHPGDFTVLAARPSMGKTAMALNIAQHVAVKLGKTVDFFSLEMSKEQLLLRAACSAARVDMQRVRLGYTSAEDRRRLAIAATDLADSKLYIDDKSAVSAADLHSRIRRQMSREPVDLVVIDYLQLMSGGKAENRNQEVTKISRGLKLMAKEINAPIVALSQLNRAVEARKGNNRPQLSDIRESGAIEQDADVVSFIFREEMYTKDREDLRGLAELIVAKQRNGPVGTVKLIFLHALTKFENRAEDVGDEPQPQFEEQYASL